MMRYAYYGRPGGSEVTPEEFEERRRRDRTPSMNAYCTSCSSIVTTVNAFNPAQPSFFRHNAVPNGVEAPFCPYRSDEDRDGLHPDNWDPDRGLSLRREFLSEQSLRIAFSFCRNLCRTPEALPSSKFIDLIRKADQKRLWDYAGIPVWAVSYMLLVLANFQGTRKNGAPYEFVFRFSKPDRSSASALWTRSHECSLVKRFESGELIKTADNPTPLSEADWIRVAGKTDWIKSEFLHWLRRQLDG